MTARVVLKPINSIKRWLETYIEGDGDELLHKDSVKFSEEVLSGITEEYGTIVDITEYYGIDNKKYYCYKVTREGNLDGTHINPKWVKEIVLSDGTVLDTVRIKKKKNDRYYMIDTYMYSNGELLDTTFMKLCSCGTIIEDETKPMCPNCIIEKYWHIKNYTYKPTPKFYGKQQRADTDHPIWYGVELEYGLTNQESICYFVDKVGSDSVYLKSDASISGGDYSAELVSHPYSFNELMRVDGFADSLKIIEAEDKPDSNGCHIHVSRTAWIDDKHYSLTYHLLEAMGEEALTKIGGRSFTLYCEFKPDGSKKAVYEKKNKLNTGKSRHVWANENNSSTVEFRFFASTIVPETFKSYVQLLDSVIKYTRYHKKTVSLDGYMRYLKKYESKYKELLDVIPKLGKKSVSFSKPKLVKLPFNKVGIRDIFNIVSITTVDGKTSKCKVLSAGPAELTVMVEGEDTSTKYCTINKITEVEVER